MKILYIITQGDGGGAQKYVLSLAKHFNGAIAAGEETEELFSQAGAFGLQTFRLKHLKRAVNLWHDILAVWEIRGLIKTFRPDILHLNSSKAGFLGSLAGMGLSAKVIFTAHGFIFNEPQPVWKKNFYLALETVASDFRDFIITVSEADKKSALAHNLIEPKKIQTVHNGLLPQDFLPRLEAQKKLGFDGSKTVIGTIANFYKTKGLDVLVRAVSQLDKNTLDKCQFVIIGDGPENSRLKTLILELSLTHNFLLTGEVANASSCLKAFDVFILPSRKEGFPFAILEAMQAGLPIIASDAGGIKEALGEAGILVETENPGQLAEALKNLLLDNGKKNTLSKKALERAGEFSRQKMLDETEKIYRQLL